MTSHNLVISLRLLVLPVTPVKVEKVRMIGSMSPAQILVTSSSNGNRIVALVMTMRVVDTGKRRQKMNYLLGQVPALS